MPKTILETILGRGRTVPPKGSAASDANVLDMYRGGYSAGEIADQLGVPMSKVEAVISRRMTDEERRARGRDVNSARVRANYIRNLAPR